MWFWLGSPAVCLAANTVLALLILRRVVASETSRRRTAACLLPPEAWLSHVPPRVRRLVSRHTRNCCDREITRCHATASLSVMPIAAKFAPHPRMSCRPVSRASRRRASTANANRLYLREPGHIYLRRGRTNVKFKAPGAKGGMNDDEGSPPASIVTVDAFGTYHGRRVAERADGVYGMQTISLVSDYLVKVMEEDRPDHPLPDSFRLPPPGAESRWLAAQPSRVAAVFCESDAGLAETERFMTALPGMGINGINDARRDKYLLHQALRSAGLPHCRQAICIDEEEALAFAADLGVNTSPLERQQPTAPVKLTGASGPSAKVVCKPRRGCGSDLVQLCGSLAEVSDAFRRIKGSPLYASAGDLCDDVLVQEYLEGPEMVVDTVSVDGEHRVTAVWAYDKRPANGGDFVYFSVRLVDDVGTDPAARAAIECVVNALDVLGFRQGPAHSEVILTKDKGAVLVEANCGRWHDMDFSELCDACIGYNAHDVAVDAWLDPDTVRRLPPWPGKLQRSGRMVHLVCGVEGWVTRVNHRELIAGLESCLYEHVFANFEEGNRVVPTVDIKSDAGFVALAHPDPAVVQRDYDTIVALMPTMFDVSETKPSRVARWGRRLSRAWAARRRTASQQDR